MGGSRARGTVAAIALLHLAWGTGGGTDLRGYLQASYGASDLGGGAETKRDQQQIRLYLRDQLFFKNQWTLEVGFDRSHQLPGGSPVERPRYASTLRGAGYQATASFVPSRGGGPRGGNRINEWRGTLSILGERWPQLSFNYLRREDPDKEGTFTDSWQGSTGLQRSWFSVRTHLQGQRLESSGSAADAKSGLLRGEFSLLPDLGSRLRGLLHYNVTYGDRRGRGPQTITREQSAGANLGISPFRWAELTGSATGRWGEVRRSGVQTDNRDALLSGSLSITPLSPVQLTLAYVRNESESATLESRQESASASGLVRLPLGESHYATTQISGGRQLASSVGEYDFVGGSAEIGGSLYRATQYRLSATVHRNAGERSQVTPFQSSRQVVVETEPYARLRGSVSYTSSYTGPVPHGLESTLEATTVSLVTQPRGLGSWSVGYTRTWNRGVGKDRYLTIYGSKNLRAMGLSLAYTRRESPGQQSGRRFVDNLQSTVEIEMRDDLTLGFTRAETDLERPGGRIDWLLNARWNF